MPRTPAEARLHMRPRCSGGFAGTHDNGSAMPAERSPTRHLHACAFVILTGKISAGRLRMVPLPYLCPKTEVKISAIHGKGLFAVDHIRVGEIVCVTATTHAIQISAYKVRLCLLGCVTYNRAKN